uniref:C-type lectin n=1 Tax=Solen grandis TaxID=165599 RepID=G9IBU9_9BIVA|nr:C-type lectin [Solen grandis]
MRNLSKRVLRGMRRIESAIDTMSSGHKKRGMGSGGRCPTGFVTLEGWSNCYLFSLFNTSWYEARDYCNAFDSEMVSLGSLKEHYVVTFLIKNNPAYKDIQGWWTSGSFVAKTKQWMWISSVTREPFSFIKWAVNEPNKSSLQCVLLYGRDDHLWHDRLCSDRYNFVCEIPLN